MMNLFSKKQVLALALLVSAILPMSCVDGEGKDGFHLQGVWVLQKTTSYQGEEITYPQDGLTWMRIYDDSCYYLCRITTDPNGMMVSPQRMEPYTYVEKGGGDCIYLQSGNTYPLTVVDDSTMVVQELGWKYTWKLTDEYDDVWAREICDVIRRDMVEMHDSSFRYVFSKVERKLETANHTLLLALALVFVLLLLIVNYAYGLRRNKLRVELELRQIEQERAARPEPLRQAMSSLEEEFHHSAFYMSLRRRIANGERLRQEDWEAIETEFRGVYPRFCSTLLSLYNMSEVELQVCLLLKLGVSPSEMAQVLCRDTSSISSIRSRLYKKVFGKKGSSRDWDEFVQTL